MINFKIMPRVSGKTTELINMYQKNRGLFFVIFNTRTHSSINWLDIKKYSDFQPGCYFINGYKCKWLYFDDFTYQDTISWDRLIELDRLKYNIVVRGCLDIGDKAPPQYFLDYMTEYWPEYLL